MKLADKPCHPMGIELHKDMAGLTFRERLIIALASNPASLLNDDNIAMSVDDSARFIVAQADAIIKELEKE